MRRRGFTLIEMVVVCAILGTLAALVYPNVVGMKANRERTEAYNSLLRLAQRGRESAILDGQTYSLVVKDGTTVTLQREKAPAKDADPRQTQSGTTPELEDVASVDLPNGASVGNVALDGKTSTASDFILHFYPDGRSEGGAFEMTEGSTVRNLTVTTQGLATLAEGIMPATQSNRWEAGQYEQRSSS